MVPEEGVPDTINRAFTTTVGSIRLPLIQAIASSLLRKRYRHLYLSSRVCCNFSVAFTISIYLVETLDEKLDRCFLKIRSSSNKRLMGKCERIQSFQVSTPCRGIESKRLAGNTGFKKVVRCEQVKALKSCSRLPYRLTMGTYVFCTYRVHLLAQIS